MRSRSTGPKTLAGKARVSRNALRHGFARSDSCISGFSEEVAALARSVAGENASPERFEQACRVAAAQIDLVQVRMAKRNLQDAANFGWASGCHGGTDLTERQSGDATSCDRKMPNWALLLPVSRLDRYEQRVLTRRRRAIQDFDRLWGGQDAGENFRRTKPTRNGTLDSVSVPAAESGTT
jgi:hypothetical protein